MQTRFLVRSADVKLLQQELAALTVIMEKRSMTIERGLRMMAGFFVLLSLGLSRFHDPRWLWFAAFVGANLLQSGFTNWCPGMWILGKNML